MNIIVVSGLDATNFVLVNIVRELKDRGHRVFIYGKSQEHLNINMFKGIVEKIEPLQSLDRRLEGDLKEIDAVFCSNDTMLHLLDVRKYIFAYSITSIFGTLVSEGGDFMFASGMRKYEGQLKENCAFMGVGNPKYSGTEEITESSKKTRNHRFLFIDSGHYPFGREGKVLLAQLLLRICEKFPQYELVIKPRFLEGDEGRTHRNSTHLYSCIRECCEGAAPDNLVMLKEYGDMNRLIGMSDTVLCMYTSAFLDVMVQEKGLVIIGNLPNRDSADMRNGFHWRIMKEECERSGCLTDYHDVLSCLPEGMHGRKGYLKRQLSYGGNASKKIVDVMEYVVQNFIAQGRFPKRNVWDCNTYQQEMKADEMLTWEGLIENRKCNFLNYHASRYLDKIKHDMDMGDYLKWMESKRKEGRLLHTPAKDLVEEAGGILGRMVVENRASLYGDPVSESHLIKAMFMTGSEYLLELDGRQSLCNRTLSYYQAEKCLKQGEGGRAVSLYKNYLEETRQSEFLEFVTDDSCYRIFPFDKIPPDQKILIYGAGWAGQKYGGQLVQSGYGELTGFVDRNYRNIPQANGRRVYGLEEIQGLEFDYIVVAIRSPSVNQQVQKELRAAGIEEDKIVSYLKN